MKELEKELEKRIEMTGKLIQKAKELDTEQLRYLEGRKSGFEDALRLLKTVA